MILEGIVELHDERMSVDAFKNDAFSFRLLNQLLAYSQGGLLQLLLGVELPCSMLLNQQDRTICAFSKTSQGFKIGSCHLARFVVLNKSSFHCAIYWFLNIWNV